ncbi:hypothetical protein SAMN05216323_104426 [Williamwhitmania taraxaci]|uniref:Uncharacterized protein n=1 Tax=Williamwhitmania taraxaci TaxID=1640674 RepID=A0A1G6NNQ3_9BACT|nr:hypothetical protein SAMN05216323_104426 [Williamwhitmania taraxaci]
MEHLDDKTTLILTPIAYFSVLLIPHLRRIFTTVFMLVEEFEKYK